MQKLLPDNKEQSEQKDIHVPGGIQSSNPSKLVAADPLLRLHGQWDQQILKYCN